MPRRPRQQHVESLVDQIDAKLRSFNKNSVGLDLRQKVLKLVEVQDCLNDLGVSVVHDEGITAEGARERILHYLIRYAGVVVGSNELRVVAGITDYPRRIRELRVEQGYQIASGASPDPVAGIDLKPDQYMLVGPDPDQDAARRWHIANRIRRENVGSRERLLKFLCENVGRVVTTEELAYVARGAKEFGRRVRELRTESGYLIATKVTGRPDLGVGQYVLETLERRIEEHDRHVPDPVQRAVYERDHNQCVCCGWSREQWTRQNPRVLELHHIIEHAGGGPNTADNLVVVCSRCHDDIHANRVRMTRSSAGVRFERNVEGFG